MKDTSRRLLSVLACIGVAAVGSRLGAAVTLVEGGRVHAIVVAADDPSPVATYAAEELTRHVELATGTALRVARESETPEDAGARGFIGVTRESEAQGLDTGALENDAFILRTLNGALFILGKDDPDALPLDPRHGYSVTMFGVSEVLERYLGVRWLWPGKLGTYVPRTDTVSVPEVDEVIAPRLLLDSLASFGVCLRQAEARSTWHDALEEDMQRNRTP